MALVLYCDEHFGSGMLVQLTDAGIQAEAFRSHKYRQPDPVQLLFAAQRGWTILTRDQEFLELHRFWYLMTLWRPRRPALHHAGILIAPQASQADIVARVPTLLAGQPVLRDSLYILSKQHGGGLNWAPHRPYARHPRRT